MKKSLILAAIFLALTTGLTYGQRGVKTNSTRQVTQQGRINEGTRSGELTRRERTALEREQRRIQIEKKMAKADGTVTPAEKRFLRKEQNRANRHIRRQKNDAQGR
ncbi:MAG: hypothetical protein U0X39_10450 [Bacteroidales bacterium]